MPLNVPVTLTLPPIDRSFTVHTERQRWSAEQLVAEPDGRAALEVAVREGVRKAGATCAYAQLTEPDIDVAEHPDGSVTMTGRVLCDEADCHSAAQRHHFDAAESIEAKVAADWVAQKELDLAPGELAVTQQYARTHSTASSSTTCGAPASESCTRCASPAKAGPSTAPAPTPAAAPPPALSNCSRTSNC